MSMTGVQGTQMVNGSVPGTGTRGATAATQGETQPAKNGKQLVPPATGVTPATPVTAVGVTQTTHGILMSRPTTVTAVPVTQGNVSLGQGIQILNLRPGHGIQTVPGRNSPMIVRHPLALPAGVRPQQQGNLNLQALPSLPPGTQGHILLKSESGQLQLVRLNVPPIGQVPQNGTTTTATAVPVVAANAFRFQQPQTTAAVTSVPASVNSQVVTVGTIIPTTGTVASVTSGTTTVVPTQAVVNNTAIVSNIAGVASPVGAQTISADSAKTKCRNFLSTLLLLANKQRTGVANNVRDLIQGLIDGKVGPEAFTEELQRDLNSSPQPCLVPFLKKTLPYLRLSLAKGELSIDGVTPPPLSSVEPVQSSTTVIPAMTTTRAIPQSGVRMVNSTSSPTVLQGVGGAPVRLATTQQVRLPVSRGGVPVKGGIVNASGVPPSSVVLRSTTAQGKSTSKDKDKKEKEFASSSSFSVADDDFYDVATMGGVNLGEESQRIIDSTGFVGTQIRSCKDETFLQTAPLHQRIHEICSKNDMDEPPKEVTSLMSHATQERLKTVLEKLSVIAEHRLDIVKSEPRYEVSQDIKAQLKFLEELDKLEKKRKEEAEREMLLRAAKSRSKNEDPEQAKLKAKAKEMQRVELEEMRQREANLTALQALQGPKKKPKLDTGEDFQGNTFSGTFTNKQIPLRPRIKRVNMRDLQFLLEQEKELNKSRLLFCSYLK